MRERRLESDRRTRPRGGRRREDAWTIQEMATHIGMTHGFVLGELKAGEFKAVKFGWTWRIPVEEVRRYCTEKGWPGP